MAPPGFANTAATSPNASTNASANQSLAAKLVHEQLVLQWSICAGKSRETALASGWFFLELMVKAMVEHLATTGRLGATRRSRFSEQFHDDVTNLVAKLTSDIVCRHRDAPEVRFRSFSLVFKSPNG